MNVNKFILCLSGAAVLSGCASNGTTGKLTVNEYIRERFLLQRNSSRIADHIMERMEETPVSKPLEDPRNYENFRV